MISIFWRAIKAGIDIFERKFESDLENSGRRHSLKSCAKWQIKFSLPNYHDPFLFLIQINTKRLQIFIFKKIIKTYLPIRVN